MCTQIFIFPYVHGCILYAYACLARAYELRQMRKRLADMCMLRVGSLVDRVFMQPKRAIANDPLTDPLQGP